MEYSALVVKETSAGQFERSVQSCNTNNLPEGDLLIRVHYSSLNYKDALSATGNKGITRKFPHTPGIDAAGVVVESRVPEFTPGQEVLVTGYDLGMNTPGGFGAYIRVPVHWVVPKPATLSLADCMVIGTAGITAGIGLYKMQQLGLLPQSGPIVVTGATGGVGSMAVAILAKAGYEVIAVSGKPEATTYLKSLGAARIENRSWVNDTSGKALLRPQWAGAIDTVGGNTLATLLKGCKLEGVIVSTGLVDSPELNTTVYPFILNGVSLVGVGSAETPLSMKKDIWKKLEAEWDIRNHFALIRKDTDLSGLLKTYIPDILKGKNTGRVVVQLP